MIIQCPWCGEREHTEFRFGGEATVMRPSRPESATDEEWADYLFYRDNIKGVHNERWVHVWGCRQWFTLVRDTATHEILCSEPPGDSSDFPDSPDKDRNSLPPAEAGE